MFEGVQLPSVALLCASGLSVTFVVVFFCGVGFARTGWSYKISDDGGAFRS